MSNPVQINLDELDAFIDALKLFDEKLSGEWEVLKGRWTRLRETWRDPACERFLNASGWQVALAEFDRYLSTAQAYTHYLEQKAVPLRQYRDAPAPRSDAGASCSSPALPAPVPSGVSWQTYQSALDKIKNGVPLTLADLSILRSPINNLQTGTLAEQNMWVRQLIAGEAHRRNLQFDDLVFQTPDSWLGFITLCAGAIASYFRWKGYWRDP